ncbi:MAG TPA: PQQ-dependent sugar dehydrogenase [Pyrinomonadaceae bacterium]|nr:PQQ-dependent sugar dehydrogenase [Chloracidobacterium sp.]HBE81588.1 hypothetical protein [Blastocatellia bacterium]HRJ88874.1 PQQ-dependent sugar dehydrogenase [Pyrinomonadaceae bacterium]HRK50364.1 PQQ-dependent sugar dehydrogenase [Pyrinomonadaceae bacterium]
MRRFRHCVCLAAAAAFVFAGMINAQSTPPFRLQQNFMTGLSSPILVTHAKDGTRRLFVVEQGGIIKVAAPGSSTTSNFMNITTRVLSGGERGLLGLAFHPQFATNSYFFVNYTRQTDGATVISRFKATNGNTVGDPNSEVPLLTIPQPFSNHNGGMIEFGPDGHLYIGMGDGGSANDPGARSQNINELLGKYLRITPNVTDENPSPAYTNPPTNPYVGVAGADEIYAIGVRNPWRWSFDRQTGQLWMGDVGQGQWEEAAIVTLGSNQGWRVYEGTQCTGLDNPLCIPGNFTMPVFQYANAGSPRCAITGGYVYRGVQNAMPRGAYLYADYCTGELLSWFNNQQNPLLDTNRLVTSFGEDEDGELYVVGSASGVGVVDKVIGSKTSADFDGDLRTDIGVFRPSTGVWYTQSSRNGAVDIIQFGLPGDIPTAKDYDGDFEADIGVFRPSTGTWYFLRSSDSTFGAVQFGSNGDIPAAGDYDGDGRSDFTVYRPSTGVWYSLRSRDVSVSFVLFGLDGDIPTPGDYDGDGRFDIAVWRPSDGVWYRLNSTNGSFFAERFGLSSDIPTQGDFDGDLKNDIAVFRPSNGVWYIKQSSTGGIQYITWGLNGDIPAVGDYDGDFRDDLAVFRPSTGVWYVRQSSNGALLAAQFGLDGDLPVPSYDKP